MKSFKEYITEMKMLAEKLLVIGKGKKYGQIIFLAGGAGSGKGFSISNFLEGEKFKVRDVDEWKKAFIRLAELKGKYPEIKGLDLNKPKDVFILHQWMKDKKIKEKMLTNMLQDLNQNHLPNVIFDTTASDKGKITDAIPELMNAGYDKKNIHLVWVLTDYAVAIKQNRNPERGRIVPEDIMLQTHEGAAKTVWSFIKNGTPRGIDGGVYIILGGKKNTVFYTDAKGKPIKTGKNKDTFVVKDFKYLTMKEPGKKMTTSIDLHAQALNWIRQNAPRTLTNKDVFGTGKESDVGRGKRKKKIR